MAAVTHIAANDVVIDGRLMRQRCAWCGCVLLDYDLQRVAVAVDDPRPPATWPAGALVAVDGHVATVLDPVADGAVAELPAECCANLDHEVTL